MTMRSIANARSCAVDLLLERRITGDTHLVGNVECRKMVARSMLRWYAGGLVRTDSDRLSRYPLRNSQNHAMNHEASCGRWVMDRRSFGPGYRQTFVPLGSSKWTLAISRKDIGLRCLDAASDFASPSAA